MPKKAKAKPAAVEQAVAAPVGTIKKTPSVRATGGRFAAYAPNDKDRTLVALGAMAGGTQERVAKVIGISVETMKKYYGKEWEDGAETANLKVIGNLYRMATMTSNDRVACGAAMYWTQTRCGWVRATDGVTAEAEARIGPVVVKLRLGERDAAGV
jgi:DNA-binding XRE family transcriptional regulator